MSLVLRKPDFCTCENKAADQVTSQLISGFVFTTWIEQSLYSLNPKFRASSHPQWLHSLVCVGPGQELQRPVFSEGGSNVSTITDGIFTFRPPFLSLYLFCRYHWIEYRINILYVQGFATYRWQTNVEICITSLWQYQLQPISMCVFKVLPMVPMVYQYRSRFYQ